MLTSLHTFDNFITSLCSRFTITGNILRALKYTAICIDFLNVFHYELFVCVCMVLKLFLNIFTSVAINCYYFSTQINNVNRNQSTKFIL